MCHRLQRHRHSRLARVSRRRTSTHGASESGGRPRRQRGHRCLRLARAAPRGERVSQPTQLSVLIPIVSSRVVSAWCCRAAQRVAVLRSGETARLLHNALEARVKNVW